ncbi:tRNA (32-2'-O)-methyltransferase regulator THADA [Battus philenor]|uniref:tRNA (32-2'-O)-methyltransferase regulator THADA n=1 Tax=Battus philenor TaxID=42288 RepID=UPI0035D0466E
MSDRTSDFICDYSYKLQKNKKLQYYDHSYTSMEHKPYNKGILNDPLYEKFSQSCTADEQLAVLKDKLNSHDKLNLRLLVLIFLQAEMKHPVKCFLMRYITKNDDLEDSFSDCLAEEILSHISKENFDINFHMEFVPKLASCIENFPAGALAIKKVEKTLAEYLTQCLHSCVTNLSCIKSLSPTEKNEIFNLVHLTLRLQLIIVQKLDSMESYLVVIFDRNALNIKELLFDQDVPMDTKSVCGILLISMCLLRNGPNSWIQILEAKNCWEYSDILENNAGKLSLYSALVTVVPAAQLSGQILAEESALLTITNNILAIGEESSSDSTLTLGVTRTLVQISKSLGRTSSGVLGLRLVDCLLTFVWSHLEHYMDSVRHLTAQALANIVRYCAELKKKGDSKALDNLFKALESLDRSRKSYYVSLTALTSQLGASCILDRVPNAICNLIQALDVQAIQASATTCMEILLQSHSRSSSSEALYRSWVKPILVHVMARDVDSAVLCILENLLLQALKLDEGLMEYLLPHIKQQQSSNETWRDDLKCILMLLSVARKSNAAAKLPQKDAEWRGLISYELLKTAAVDALDETRTLALGLVVDSPKSTEPFTVQELDLVLWYLTYNINAEAPNFRQLTLSMMKKFIKRLEDSYKVLKRQKDFNSEENKVHYYLTFMESLRKLCYRSLMPGVNYSRRYVALQVLVWCETATFEGYQKTWTEEYVENLLLHLEDSYESNKAFALCILQLCPVELIQSQKHVVGLKLEEVLQQASSVKPTDCVSAAYKLSLLSTRLPETVLKENDCEGYVPEAVQFAALRVLVRTLRVQLQECTHSVVRAARHAPMYGVLHCMLRVLEHLDVRAISKDTSWARLVGLVVDTCMEVTAAVACVVNNSSPEGHLPMDMSGVVVTDHGNSGNVRLEDGRPVTAQMVLLCAWRSVKEVSLVLGSISSRMSIEGEEQEGGTLTQQQLVLMGEHFTKLLAETKHRGAFEQAYVGFTKLLARLWRCRSPSLHELPRNWLRELMVAIANDDGSSVFSATRRSAGLPFMIQALVTTELQVSEKPKCFQECMGVLLEQCARGPARSRAHCCNVLRALVRCSALQQSVAPYVGDALLLALKGFDGSTWEERNSSTLLLSALVVRVFGVARGKDSERLPTRNRMTGRVFFLRYPRLYDFMLKKLNEVKEEEQLLKPSLYPILLLLARLYPSALEGTVSNLKLSCFVDAVVSCARSPVLQTRQLAARALVPLISPAAYVSHIEDMLQLLSNNRIERNFCHGILLQVIKLLDNRPDDLVIDDEAVVRLKTLIDQTSWIQEQSDVTLPCYPLIDEYLKMMNSIVWRFPSLVDQDMVEKIIPPLDMLLDRPPQTSAHPGWEVCLANATSLYLVLLNKYGHTNDLIKFIHKTLSSSTYEVILSALDYLLNLKTELEVEGRFLEHLSLISKNNNTIDKITEDTKYTETLYKVLQSVKYLECRQKCLKLLSLEDNTFGYIIQDVGKLTNEEILSKLCNLVESVHENMTHIYLYSLSNFVTGILKEGNVNGRYILEAIRVIFACSSSDNSDATREVVVAFLEKNFKVLIDKELEDLSESEKFETKATLWACLVSVLEDDEVALRRASANIVAELGGAKAQWAGPTVCARAAQLLREHVCERDADGALLCVLALLDFGCHVRLTEDCDDECRVFDQNEKYNVFLEESVWAAECADALKQKCSNIPRVDDACAHALRLLDAPVYRDTFVKLCGSHVEVFKSLLEDSKHLSSPKVEVFVRQLRRTS